MNIFEDAAKDSGISCRFLHHSVSHGIKTQQNVQMEESRNVQQERFNR
jgi:hypothetical protein